MPPPDYSQAIRLYQSGLSCRRIAQQLGKSSTTIHKWLKRAGVALRTRRDAATRNTLVVTPRLRAVVDGLLLGGAHIDSDGRLTITRTHSDPPLMAALTERLTAHGVKVYPYREGLRSGRYEALYDERMRWTSAYPPLDLVLEPVTLALWYALTGGCMTTHIPRIREFIARDFGWRFLPDIIPSPEMRESDRRELEAIIRPHLSSVMVGPRRVPRPTRG